MNKKGFTLIELLSVITILGIIALIVIPNIVDIQNKELYEKVVCSYGNETKEFKIDKMIYNLESEIKIESNGKTYELQKINCYLVGKENTNE